MKCQKCHQKIEKGKEAISFGRIICQTCWKVERQKSVGSPTYGSHWDFWIKGLSDRTISKKRGR